MQIEIDQRIQFVFFDFNSEEKNEIGQKVGEGNAKRTEAKETTAWGKGEKRANYAGAPRAATRAATRHAAINPSKFK